MAEWKDDEQLADEYSMAGDSRILEILYRRHVGSTYAFTRRYLETREDAEEATSETWLRVFRALRAGQFRGAARFRSWVFGVCRNVCLERRRQPKLPTLSLSGLMARDDRALFPPAVEPAGLVADALIALSEDHRLVLTLCDLHGLTAAEAAEVLDRSVAATKSLHIRARRALRDALLPEIRDE
ncbi:MAG: RNA polymerase sigma factor [Capsulimonadaceae bacterium]